jgi:hypothetical protein
MPRKKKKAKELEVFMMNEDMRLKGTTMQTITNPEDIGIPQKEVQ